MIIFNCGFSMSVTCAFLLLENIGIEVYTFKPRKMTISYYWSDKGFDDTVVNQ